eukprot:COSAG01_NODE_8527_length_2752_cov_4.049378_1_plen_608_part_10
MAETGGNVEAAANYLTEHLHEGETWWLADDGDASGRIEPEAQGLPEGVPPRDDGAAAVAAAGVPLDRQSTAGLVAALTAHLMGEVGIARHGAAQAYAVQLVEAGYESASDLGRVSLEELAETYAWGVGHVAKIKAWREMKHGAPAAAADPVRIAAALRAPPCAQLAAGGGGDPFAADRDFFRPAAPVPAGVDALFGADNLNQGRSSTCVRYALAAAITDNVNARVESSGRLVDFAQAKLDRSCQQGIVDGLLQFMDHAGGCNPAAFDALSVNTRDAKGRLYSVRISVTENTTMNQRALNGENLIDRSRRRKTHVIGYRAGAVHGGQYHGRHCIYLEGCDLASCEWLGLNSWGDHDQRPRISMHSQVSIYDVEATWIEVLQGSSITNALSGESKTLTENLLLHPLLATDPEAFWAWVGEGCGGAALAAVRVACQARPSEVGGDCTLYLDRKNIGDGGAAALGRALASLPRPLPYTEIVLGENGLGPAGVRSVTRGLRLGYGGGGGGGRGLERLWLHGNPFGGDAEAVGALAAALPPTLKALGLESVGLGDVGLGALLLPLGALPALEVLSLSNNELRAEGFGALGAALPSWGALRALFLNGNGRAGSAG